ncbi:GNAT family N-acetyltransferase [Pseudokineococcus sp. 5B2Z-1]|uniref:GNAT family N-acetyltransferase n=1 Tax=Pseudokineococcus sp. 5B2Z-1 TaxID=3132744 RepID=UPI0030AF49FF
MPAPSDPPPDAGQRVVVRHRLADGSATDVVGELERAGDPLVVRRADGGVVEVRAHDVVAARRVPPRVRRPRPGEPVVGVLDLEAALARAWLPTGAEPDGRWLLRSAGDRTRRASSVLALGPPGPGAGGLAGAVDRASAWLSARGSTPRFQLPRSTGAPVGAAARADAAGLAAVEDLDAELDGRGWALVSPTTVMVGALPTTAAVPATTAAPAPVDVLAAPDAAWSHLVRPGEADDPVVAALLLSAPDQAFAVVRPDPGTGTGTGKTGARTSAPEGAVAAGRMALADGWAVLTDLVVAPEHRRRGLARAAVTALSAWAARHGAERLALQVADGNDAARALYEDLGLAEHHRYAYREAPRA